MALAKLAGRVVGFISAVAMIALTAPEGRAADLFIADRPEDQGVEPNSNAPAFQSEDIWIRQAPDPNYNPAPFTAASPPWTPQAHQNARYADPRFGAPNWIYVRVRNRGTGATPAGARLKLYWSKVSGAQNWPTAWVDHFASTGGQSILHGMEITKPRRNAAIVSQSERDAYVKAILAIDGSGHAFPDGETFWDKQNTIHSNSLVMAAAHGNPAFLPWHREFLNRYEALLQTADPTLKLLYWDWTRDPRQPINGFSYFTTSFMGAIGAGATTAVREPFVPLMSPVQVVRNGRPANQAFGTRSDSSVLNRAQYHNVSGTNGLRTFIETGNYHSRAHVDIGGSQPSTCASDPSTCNFALSWVAQAVRDPFFFLLHGNVDRLWAQWQRANPQRHDARPGATPYGLDSNNVNITRSMTPWDGSAGIPPWTPGAPEVNAKSALDPSVVSPPIYDTAPLTIPVLQAGQAAVLQIPWYPPDPARFSGSARRDFAVLARIETSTTPPYGMTYAEVTDVRVNVRNNNNIARRTVTVLDGVTTLATARAASAATALAEGEPVAVANDFDALVLSSLCTAPGSAPVDITLPDEVLKRWRDGGSRGAGITALSDGRVQIAPGGRLEGIPLAPGESFDVLAQAQGGVVELQQLGAPGDPEAVIGRIEVGPAGDARAAARARATVAPTPQFLRPGQTVSVPAAELGDPAQLDSVTLYVDGKAVETRRRPPFDVTWKGEGLGGRELRIEARDRSGAVTTVTRVVTVAENLPPSAALIAPGNDARFPLGAPIPVEAQATDPNGSIARVDFYLQPMAVFGDPVLVASAAAAPYAVALENVAAGTWMLSAVAVDDAGIEGQSVPIHITVAPAGGARP